MAEWMRNSLFSSHTAEMQECAPYSNDVHVSAASATSLFVFIT